MRALHLFANHKWTGPAEPALNLCLTLSQYGVEVVFACSPGLGGTAGAIVEKARDRGIEPLSGFHLSKHRHVVKNFSDRRRLSNLLRNEQFDVVHCHMDNDHRIASSVARSRGVPLVRSSYYGEGLAARGGMKRVLTDTRFLIEPSRSALESDALLHGFNRRRMRVVQGAVDMARFDPARDAPDGRKRLNIPQDSFVIGIVARMQRHRHFEDFWLAMQQLIASDDSIHVIVIGRGTHQEKVGKTPVREAGIEANVHFPGYLSGDEYVGMVKALDVKVFLVPGSDGTCRAVREALALAVPAVVSDRGVLPEIVEHGTTGYVCDGSAKALVQWLGPLSGDRARVRELGQAAHAHAAREFSLDAQARAVLQVYESL